MYCTGCGQQLAPGYAFCPHCGSPVAGIAQAGPVAPLGPFGAGTTAYAYRFRKLGGASVGVLFGCWLYWLLSIVPFVVIVVRWYDYPGWGQREAQTVSRESFPAILLIASVFAFGGFVALLIWLYRARANLTAIPGAQPSWNAGWTIAAWFIPLANLFLVPAVVADVARNSGAAEPRRPHLGALAVCWWVFWALGALLLNGANSGAGADLLVALALFGCPMVLVANVLLTVLLIRVNRVQDRAASNQA
ncbi:MAG: hypothetical protein AUI14_09810 [Actinobacteria bacterium 13_2_20CM_2_71_6]|nr:MAG: hypothetical protein AUI14_09810 [Actinobacteria bacterium 13_2_20CM_2_71_6]